jgi:hypothetical protein
MITQDQVLPLLLEACLASREALEADRVLWGGYIGPFVDMTAFVRFLVDCFERGETDCFPAAFATIERVLAEGDMEARNLAVVGFIEDLQNLGHAHEAAFMAYLGPLGRHWWDEVNELWAPSGMPQVAMPPPDHRVELVPWKTVESGGKPVAALLAELEAAGVEIAEAVRAVCPKIAPAKERRTLTLARMSAKDLGFSFYGSPFNAHVNARIREVGSELCPPEVALELIQVLELGEWAHIAMEPIVAPHGGSTIIEASRTDDGRRWLFAFHGDGRGLATYAFVIPDDGEGKPPDP